MGTQVKTIACFGGSGVSGHGDTEQNIGWTGALAHEFHTLNPQEESESTAAFYNLGILGETALKLARRVENELAVRHRVGRQTLSIFSVGLNDSLRRHDGTPLSSPLEFAGYVEQTVKGLIAYSDQILYVGLTEFDESKTQPFRGRDAIFEYARALEFESIAAEVSAQMGAETLPLLELSSTSDFRQNMLHDDGLHPNSAGHKWIYAKVSRVANKLWWSDSLKNSEQPTVK